MKEIKFGLPLLGEEEYEAVKKVLESGWLTTGPKTREFEQDFKVLVGSRNAIAVNSCTGGMHSVLKALGIGPGDEVIIPAYTFVATAQVIDWVGARPVLVDIEPESRNIDVKRIKEAITSKTRAIIPVHFAGHPCRMDEICRIAREHNLFVLEDAAHAAGSSYKGTPIGGLDTSAAVFSFYPTKNITTGEGGMVTTNDDRLAALIRKYAFFGIDREVWERHGRSRAWSYDIVLPGYKYNITDIASAIGIVQLKRLNGFNQRRKALAKRYKQALSGIKEIILPRDCAYGEHSWHLFTILVEGKERMRDKLIDYLFKKGIGTSIHFIPLHLFSYYQKRYGYREGDFQAAEDVFSRILSLPLYPGLEDDQLDYIIQTVSQRHWRSRRRRSNPKFEIASQ